MDREVLKKKMLEDLLDVFIIDDIEFIDLMDSIIDEKDIFFENIEYLQKKLPYNQIKLLFDTLKCRVRDLINLRIIDDERRNLYFSMINLIKEKFPIYFEKKEEEFLIRR